ncbi:MAG TPA: hypothetical protein GX517_02235 [Alicyclobacillus sp.]|nr:hypothetical protein [Alicyclobacillus sp.]
MVSKNLSRFRRTMREAGLFLVTALVFFLYCLSLGLDLWNDDKFGGTPADQPIEKGFQSLEEAKNASPVTYSPSDFIRTFNLKVAQKMGNYGEGETIAFLQSDSRFDEEAYLEFCRIFSKDYPELVPATRPLIFVKGKPLSSIPHSSTNIETMLDVEWAHVIAPKARLLIIDIFTNNAAQIQSIINQYHVSAVSSSIIDSKTFTSRNPILDALIMKDFQRVSTLKWLGSRTAYFVSSGDAGSNINPAVVAPESVIVGGIGEDEYKTSHDLSNVQIWPNEGHGSAVFSALAPGWQKTANSHHYFWRQVPDVVWLAGYPGVFYATNQGWFIGQGTSLSAPCWAALWALGDAAHRLTSGSPLPPQPNQILYWIAHVKPDAFIKPSAANTWAEKWGLGYPNVPTLTNSMATFNAQELQADPDSWIETAPFCTAFGLFIIVVVAYATVYEETPKKRKHKKKKSRRRLKTWTVLAVPRRTLERCKQRCARLLQELQTWTVARTFIGLLKKSAVKSAELYQNIRTRAVFVHLIGVCKFCKRTYSILRQKLKPYSPFVGRSLLAMLAMLAFAPLATIIVMQIPTNLANLSFQGNKWDSFISLITSRLFAFFVMWVTFSYLAFSFAKKRVKDTSQEPEPLASGKNRKKQHGQLR